MQRAVAALSLGLGLAWAASALAAIDEPVKIETGLLAGTPGKDPSVTAFKGIPYAAPPIGALRWKAPQPAKPWTGVRNADTLGPMCAAPQGGGGGGDRPMSEDCLTVSVWTGASSSAEKRPVMVWFHGGGAGAGAGDSPNYDGEALAKKGVIVVGVNYRSGVLGMLALPELTKESGHKASGNYNLMDDAAALKWVQRNISAFGGDPKNVTIFGQSFGSTTEHFLSISPLAKGTFKGMINESHAHYARDPELFEISGRYHSLKQGEADGVAFLKVAGVRNLRELRALPLDKLEAAYAKSSPRTWTYLVEGYVLPRGYSKAYAAGAQGKIFEMAGANLDESGAWPETAFDIITGGSKTRGNFPAVTKLSDYIDHAHKKYGPMADEFLKLYPATTDREAFLSYSASMRDNNRMSPWMWATTWAKKNPSPVHLYFWTHRPPGPNHDLYGASHASEIPYVFGHPTPAWTDQDRKLSDLFQSYWVNFARTGDPNGPGLPNWAAFDGKTEEVMEIGEHFGPMPIADPVKIAFWKRFYASQPAA